MLFSPIRSKMAHVLDLLRSSVPLTNVYNWLQTAQESEVNYNVHGVNIKNKLAISFQIEIIS